MKTDIPYISELRIKNFKSYKNAIINLKPFSVLVGPNASGKTNLVDALAFISDAVYRGLDFAISSRGGITRILHKPTHSPGIGNFGMSLRIEADGREFYYGFEISKTRRREYVVNKEFCIHKNGDDSQVIIDIQNGEMRKAIIDEIPEEIDQSRLLFGLVGTSKDLSPVYNLLSGISLYTIKPDLMFSKSSIEEDEEVDSRLVTNGNNSHAILWAIYKKDRDIYNELCDFLSLIIPVDISPDFMEIEGRFAEDKKKSLLVFLQKIAERIPTIFWADQLSEGTIRALGILLAIYQPDIPPVVIIEHPEDAIHPAAFEVLVDVLKSGTDRAQVIITTHSADILDDKDIKDDEIIYVVNEDGVSYAGPVDATTREIIRDNLTTPGELLRTGELRIDEASTQIDDSEDFLFAGFDG